jgi:hypothetical protein
VRFLAFSLFIQKLTFRRSKSQLKSLPFVPAFSFSTFRLEMPAEKQEQTGPKYCQFIILTFIAGLLWATGWWTMGPIPDIDVLAPVPHPVGPIKAGTTKPMKCCDIMMSGCSTSSR